MTSRLNPGLLDAAQSRPLTVYRLNSTTPIDSRKLSAASKPSRYAKVAEVDFVQDDTSDSFVWHRKFSCAEEEVLTFEIGCGITTRGDACDMEWWQDKEHPNPGSTINSVAANDR